MLVRTDLGLDGMLELSLLLLIFLGYFTFGLRSEIFVGKIEGKMFSHIGSEFNLFFSPCISPKLFWLLTSLLFIWTYTERCWREGARLQSRWWIWICLPTQWGASVPRWLRAKDFPRSAIRVQNSEQGEEACSLFLFCVWLDLWVGLLASVSSLFKVWKSEMYVYIKEIEGEYWLVF